MELEALIGRFDIAGRLVSLKPFGNGNINDTYLAIFRDSSSETQVVLQRVNRAVFPDPAAVMRNMRRLTDHCHAKLEADARAGRDDRVWQLPRVVAAKDGADFVADDRGEVWRVITRVMSARAFDVVQGPAHAEECGAALGHFHYLVSDLDPAQLADPLPGFHVTSGYLAKYDATLASADAAARLAASEEARRLASFVEARRGLALGFEEAVRKGELKRRMFHGDPKVNNIMIDDVTGKGTAMIDLDTVSPGLVHVDFGDALRSICNPAGEEVTDLSQVVFDEGLAAAFCRGYMREAGAFLTDADRAWLFDSIRLLPFELGLRFFQDHLAGDVYFKTSRPGQNLDRARVQFRLCECVEEREPVLRALIEKL